jgi:hypothetical protein
MGSKLPAKQGLASPKNIGVSNINYVSRSKADKEQVN